MSELAEIFCGISDLNSMNKFMSEILTEVELKDLKLRWELIKKLNSGTSQRVIASELGISLCKITRGAKILKDNKSICNTLLNG